MDIIFRFEKNSDFNKLALRLMLLVIIYTAFAVYMIGYYYPRKNGWDIYYMVGTIVIVFLASIELVSKTIDIFINSRTVTIDKNGLNITLHKTYNYAWNDLKTVSIENINKTYINSIDSSDYNGRVLLLSSKKIKRLGLFHPYYINKIHPCNMVCVYFGSSVNHNVPLQSFRDYLQGPYLRLYEGDESEVRNALQQWGIELTYDCFHD